MTWSADKGSLDATALHRLYDEGTVSPADVIDAIYERIARADDSAIWITLLPRETVRAAARLLPPASDTAARAALPLYGLPFAVKDNIDVDGVPTTAACPAFSYVPEHHATVVARLVAAGAIVVGKTNLDQFATGLVGVRSPYGVPKNAFDPDYIPGGSSSGSAVAVARGLVSFALGTDTAGSGRVPAGFNNIVGLKPTRGLVSAAGVVPACRSLDCVSIFALSVGDAMRVLGTVGAPDALDPFSRAAPAGFTPILPQPPTQFQFGVPRADQLKFFGDDAAAALFDQGRERMRAIGGTEIPIDFAPFEQTAALLYAGPWVAERTTAVDAFLAAQPDAVHPITRQIIERGRDFDAVDTFNAMYRLEALRRLGAEIWRDVDLLLVPTSGTIYTRLQLEAEPVLFNSNLGFYTNFVNLQDMAALAVPNAFYVDGLPAGVTLIGPAYSDAFLAGLGDAFHRICNVPMGATEHALPAPPNTQPAVSFPNMELAVFGAHMQGQPLNGQMRALGAKFVQPCRTRSAYRMYALGGGGPARPGLVHVAGDEIGAEIEGEIWSLPLGHVGAFLATIAPPLGLGTVELDDGRAIKGFVCEGRARETAPDITAYGGWRRYRAAQP